MDSYSKTLLSVAAVTIAVIVGFGVFLYNRKPESSAPPVLPAADESLQRTEQRAFVNFINVFQAEDYDIGGPEVAFHFSAKDLVSGNKYRTDAVNIFPIQPDNPNGGYFLGNLHSGDWIQYTLSVPTDGNYILKAHAAKSSDDEIYELVLSGRTLASFQIPKLGAQTDANVTVTTDAFEMPAGQHTLRVQMKEGNNGRLDWFQGVKVKGSESIRGEALLGTHVVQK